MSLSPASKMLSSKLLSCPFSVPRTQQEDMRCDSLVLVSPGGLVSPAPIGSHSEAQLLGPRMCTSIYRVQDAVATLEPNTLRQLL